MSILEMVLLGLGCVLFALGFLLPGQKEQMSDEAKKATEKEINKRVSQEMDAVKSHVDAVVDESIEYATEKTERSLERLSNEKIMAINEYSDTVLQEIHKNHEEVMFLYDMLNHKHDSLKNTVSEVNKTVQNVEETKKEAEAVVQSFHTLKPEPVKEEKVLQKPSAVLPEESAEDALSHVAEEFADQKFMNQKFADKKFRKPLAASDLEAEPASDQVNHPKPVNSNQQILMLYKQGEDKISIAQKLGLGVGEVKLVIDLYQSIENWK